MIAALLGASGATPLALNVVFGAASGYFGYRLARRHRAVRGVTPWRLPTALWTVWGVACGFFLVPLGLMLEVLASYTTRNRAPAVVAGRAAPYGVSGAGTASEPAPEPVVETGPPPPRDASGQAGAFGWYPDVVARHELRYFDGRRWSDHVADGGVVTSDPV